MNRTILRAGALWAALALLMTACELPAGPDPGTSQTGTLQVLINDGVSQMTLLPDLDMTPGTYAVSGVGPGGAVFGPLGADDGVVTESGLVTGEWVIAVTAYNEAGEPIGEGTGVVEVLVSQTAALTVTVRAYEGVGTLTLELMWNAAEIAAPKISATLRPVSGEDRNLAFTEDEADGLGHFSAADIAAGYHTLIVKLLDGKDVKRGTVVMVRIARAAETVGTIDFRTSGALMIMVAPEMGDPLEVTVSGGAELKALHQVMQLGAEATDYAENVTYIWYVNGVSTAEGAAYDFGVKWPEGTYNVDVTAINADLTRAGSSGVTVTVIHVEYQVGDTGPAGGHVFYDKGSYSDDWRYLEAAPVETEWTAAPWGGYGTLVGTTETELGTGAANTAAIVAEYGDEEPYASRADYAAKLCADLSYAGHHDWFLPSTGEMQFILLNLFREQIGDFDGSYWSSSEESMSQAQYFSYVWGLDASRRKDDDYRVRAVRAF